MRTIPKRPLALSLALAMVASGTFTLAGAAEGETPEQLSDQAATAEALTSDTVAEETDQLILTLAEEQPAQETQNTVAEAEQNSDVLEGAEVVKEEVGKDNKTVVVKNDEPLNAEEQKKAIETLEADPRIDSVEPDYVVKATAATMAVSQTAAFEAQRYYLDATNTKQAWNTANGAGVTMAILDTGITNHPYLNSSLTAGYDFVSDEYYGRDGVYGRDSDPTDTGTWIGSTLSNWHGTHVTGVAKSTAPGATILPYRVMGMGGSGYISDFADGVVAAADRSSVINLSMSWYSASCPSVMGNAINYAYTKNVPVVIAAGNSGADAGSYAPANCLGAIVVGATTSWGTMTSYSNYGWPLDVVAPGGTVGSPIWSTYNTGAYGPAEPAYGTLNGTSQATPQVTGIIAMMKQRYPGMSIEAIRAALKDSGRSIGGYPLVNAQRAVEKAAAAGPAISRFSVKAGSGIAAKYYSGGGASTYGNPTSNEFSTRDGGVAQQFSNNYTIYWTSRLGASSVKFTGAIGAKYRSVGYENGYGYPMADEAPTGVAGGYYQRFITADNRRYAVYWTPSTGARTVYANGAIGNRFNAAGALTGWGYPTMDEVAFWDGAKQVFTNNGYQTAVYWTPQYGAHTMNARGGIFNKWAASGDFRGYGKPLTDEQPTSGDTSGAVAYFKNDKGGETGLFWSPRTPTVAVNSRGALYYYWVNNGYTSAYGFPLHDERSEADGKVHLRFSSGVHLTWTAREGVRRVS